MRDAVPADSGPGSVATPGAADRGVRARQPATAHAASETAAQWTFLTNHAHVLRAIAAHPGVRVRDVADRVGITERAALRILHDLDLGGYVLRERVGRRTRYRLNLDQPMRHPMERGLPIAVLVHALDGEGG
jgi:hypothetical protein